MLQLLTDHQLLLAFIAGAVTEYLAPKVVAKLKALHPGMTITQDIEAKITSIVDARIAANTNTDKTA